MEIFPAQNTGTASPLPPTSLTVDERALREITDPWQRAEQAAAPAGILKTLSKVVLGLRRQAVHELVQDHKQPKAKVARHIGVSTTRVCQMVETPGAAKTEAVMA